MPSLPTNPHSIGDSGHVNDHNTIVTALTYFQTYQQGSKNKVINSNFAVNQRVYASGANLASGAYGFDRWKSNYTNTTLTFTAATQGQTLTINSGGGIQQIIERSDIPSGSYTLSWTGTATGRIFNVGASAPSYAASPITVTLDGSANVCVEFTASGATKTLGQVQLERGTSGTAYEWEDFGTTLRKCLRFYEKSYDLATAAGTNTTNGLLLGSQFPTLSGSGQHVYKHSFMVPKAQAPTVTVYDNPGTANTVTVGGVGDGKAATVDYKSEKGFRVYTNANYASYGIAFHFVADAEF